MKIISLPRSFFCLTYPLLSLFLGYIACFFSLTPAIAETPIFSKPVNCIADKECIIQQYVDLNPSSATLDYKCGQQTYDGHKGTDFRLVNARIYEKGVEVIASAPGTVLRVRDGIADKIMKSKTDRAEVEGKECGNGVVISHGNGWESQYCHLKKNSLTVQPGQTVSRGEQLGLIGLSGKTQMPHVHLTIRHNGIIVDPFSGVRLSSKKNIHSCEIQANPLMDDETLRSFPYQSSHIMEVGFTSRVLKTGERETQYDREPLTPLSDKLLIYARVANFLKGDRIKLFLVGPDGFKIEQFFGPLERNKARYVAFSGKKRRLEKWPSGTYEGVVTILRKTKIIHKREIVLNLK